MLALPPHITPGAGRQLSGLACPDCPGALTVEVQGRKGHLHFTCRIGHTYAVPALLAAKEQAVEERLWSAVLTVEEMAALLRDLEGQAARQCWSDVEGPCRERAGDLEAHARTLRRLIEQDRPLSLGFEAPASEEPGSPA